MCRCQQAARDVYKKNELVQAGYVKISGKKDGVKLSIEGAAPEMMQSYRQLSHNGGPWKALTYKCDRLRINRPLAANIDFTLREFKVQ